MYICVYGCIYFFTLDLIGDVTTDIQMQLFTLLTAVIGTDLGFLLQNSLQ